jgi:hypothetical protein
MTRRPRRNHTLAAKAKVALAAIKGDGGSTAYRRDPACDPAEWSDQPAGLVRFASLLINLPSLADTWGLTVSGIKFLSVLDSTSVTRFSSPSSE